MELTPSTSGSTSTSTSSSPAPFLLKTYEMVDDNSTDEIVSWGPTLNSFIVWNPPEFSRLLLPAYFKHSNFSSFIRQLNTYGFRKIDPEKWEFANEEFIKDKKHLLKNIHRRKPIHSHSQPPPDPERLAFEEEIEKLSREKNELEANVSGFQTQHSVAKSQLEDITQRIGSMEQRQQNLLSILRKAVQDPAFVGHLTQKIESMDLLAYSKKRRLPRIENSQPALENNFGDNQSSCRPEVSIYQPESSSKLRLELSTAVSNMDLVSNSTPSSSEDWASPTRKSSEAEMRDAALVICTLPFTTETLEIPDTEICVPFKTDSSMCNKVGVEECAGLQSLQPSLVPTEETEGNMLCQLNLSLASSPIQSNQNLYSGKVTPMEVEVSKSQEIRADDNRNQSDLVLASKNDKTNISSSTEAPRNNQGSTRTAPTRVNDQFWEQFLTERPGSSDTEEASSCYRAPHDDLEDRGLSHGMSRNAKNLGNLTL